MPEFQLPDFVSEFSPEIGLVLGSGLGSFADRITPLETIPYADIAGLPISKVPGHAGQFLFGELNGTRLVIAQGRVHLYEGWTAREISAGIRAMAEMGIKQIILTNAAGIVNEDFTPGQWMMITDHLNFTGQSPLFGGANFVDQTEVYSKTLRKRFSQKAAELEIDLKAGVYAWMPGPQYETPAEIRMVRTLGADAVGMSTVPEAIQARALNIEVAGFSCLTNYGAGMTDALLDHSEVVEMGARAAGQLVDLLAATLGSRA